MPMKDHACGSVLPRVRGAAPWEGALEMAVPNYGFLHMGRPRSREVWWLIQGDSQPASDLSDPSPGF